MQTWYPLVVRLQTEWIYCFLSAASKIFLGLLLLINVLLYASFDEALANTPASRMNQPPSAPPVG